MAATPRRYLAFLRGMNVGGHRVSMDDLRRQFDAMGFTRVETFIASGNVIFDSDGRTAPASLERTIEARLQGNAYPVATARTPAELTDIVDRVPFHTSELATPGHTVHVGFLRASPGDALISRLAESATRMDAFGTGTREMYWLCRGRTTDSLVKWPMIEKAFALEVTMRNLTTVRKLVTRYG
jgi:uncharacterized protein (DUF1697 family)